MNIYKLEDRVLYDAAAAADAEAADTLSSADTADSNDSDNSSDQADKAESSATAGESQDSIDLILESSLIEPENGVHVLLISDEVEGAAELAESASSDTIVILYDADSTTAEQLLADLSDALDGQQASCIGIIAQSDTDGDIDLLENDSDTAFWQSVSGYMTDDARIDFFGSDLSDSSYVDQVAEITGHEVAYSTDTTGVEGDWLLEIGDIDLEDIYFGGDAPDVTLSVEDASYTTLVIIDSAVLDVDEIVDDLDDNTEILYLDADSDLSGLEQINAYLEESGETYDSISIVTHGNDGYIVLTGDIIDSDYAANNADEFAELGSYLSDDGDILLYSCNTTESSSGEEFVDLIADLTGADVAASTDSTTNADDGNWDLEYTTGIITTDALTVEGYTYHLAAYTVTSNADSGAGTLRYYAETNAVSGSEIIFDLVGTETITLSSTLTISVALTIDGDNVDGSGTDVTITANGSFSVLTIASGTEDVVVENLTVEGYRDGSGVSTISYGGCIYNAGELSLVNVTVTNGYAIAGCGIYNTGDLTITSSTVSGNSTDYGSGGGIYNNGVLLIISSSISSNEAGYGSGGGIYNNGEVTITSSSSIDGNTATYGSGGGIYNNGEVTISLNSTLDGNTATNGSGGGIYNNGTVTVTLSSSISGNTATYGAGGGVYNNGTLTITSSTIGSNISEHGDGGGIYNNVTLTITSSTISSNYAYFYDTSDAEAYGGGIFNVGTATITSSTISGNYAYASSDATVLGSFAAAAGGGIENQYGTLILVSSYISGNYTYSYDASETGAASGGIENYFGTLTITSCTINNNYVYSHDSEYISLYGGGIYNDSGTLTVTSSTISNNYAYAYDADNVQIYGGGICSYSGTLTITTCTFNSNNVAVNTAANVSQAGIMGGAIYIDSGTMTMISSTLSGNYASCNAVSFAGAAGGSIENYGGKMTIDSCTVSDNYVTATAASGEAEAYGGGIDNCYGEMVIISSTISDNYATAVATDAETYGGGISNYDILTIVSSTISGNYVYSSANACGGGIYNYLGTVYLVNSIIAYNYSNNSGTYVYDDIYNDSLNVYAYYSILGTVSGVTEITGNINYTYSSGKGDFLFDSYSEKVSNTIYVPVLADNGGYTYTVALDSNSIAGSTGCMVGTYVDSGMNYYAFSSDGGSTWYAVDGTETTAVTTEVTAITTDQRGYYIDTDNISIGAYQYDAIVAWTGGDGSFSAALATYSTVALAVASANGATIYLVNSSIALSSTLEISSNTVITSGDDGIAILRGTDGAAYRPVTISGGTVSISNITISGSDITGNTGVDSYGGVIYVASGALSLTDVTVTGGTAVDGGGIYNAGTLTITSSTISDNTSYADGGGIYNVGTSIVADCTISSDFALSEGGGIYNSNEFTLSSSTISDNDAVAGAGIANSGVFALVSSTVSDNEAVSDGGGIYNIGALYVLNSTISGNSASYGGGIYTSGGYTYIVSSIVTYNNADYVSYDDIYVSAGTVDVYYSIYGTVNGSLSTVYKSSLYSYGADGVGRSLFGSYRKLAEDIWTPVLADNGGDTLTLFLASDSIAVNAGCLTGSYVDGYTKYAYSTDDSNWYAVEDGSEVSAAVSVNSTDQTGNVRTAGSVDAGAVEYWKPLNNFMPPTDQESNSHNNADKNGIDQWLKVADIKLSNDFYDTLKYYADLNGRDGIPSRSVPAFDILFESDYQPETYGNSRFMTPVERALMYMVG